MARKPVHRALPKLRAIHADFRGFSTHSNMTAVLQEKLRKTVSQVRLDKAHPFYSQREVSRFFRVPLRSVAVAYKQLEAEGLLSCVRGSATLVHGRKVQPRRPLKGVVGLPVYLPGFVIGSAGRSFYICLEEELRRHHYVADFIFYRAEDEANPDLAERLIEHQLDVVVWLTPSGDATATILRLLDGGIKVVVLGDGKARFPRQQYFVNLERGIGQCIQGWQREGIDSILMLESPANRAEHDLVIVKRALQGAHADHSLVEVADADVPEQVSQLLGRKRLGVIFTYHRWYESLCSQFPQIMEQLFRSSRVLLVQGPVVHPLFQGKNLLVDSIRWNYAEIARRIAADLSAGKSDTAERLATFHTRWQPRVDLGRVSREI